MDLLERRRIKLPKSQVEGTLHFRKYRSFFDRIITDDRERIYIQRTKSIFDDRVNFEFDVFGKEGIYLYVLNLPFSPEIIHNGCIYAVQMSAETGATQIKRYRVKNWSQIRERN